MLIYTFGAAKGLSKEVEVLQYVLANLDYTNLTIKQGVRGLKIELND